jgi:hypothetical protein
VGELAAATVAWPGSPCSPRAGLGLDTVPIRVVSVRSAPCCASPPLNGELWRRFLLMNVYGNSMRCTVNCGSRVRVGSQVGARVVNVVASLLSLSSYLSSC